MEKISPKSLRGGIIFVILLVLIFLAPDIYKYFQPDIPVTIEQSDPIQEKITQLAKEGQKNYRPRNKRKYSVPPAKFNPNSYTLADWMHLGLSEKQSAVILKFTRYGIKSNEDLRKIFVIDEELFNLLKDSTVYDSPDFTHKSNEKSVQKQDNLENFIVVDLNKATVEELDEVPGIGQFYAKNIVKTREKLGGFYEMQQLLDVWKVTPEQIAQWSPHFIINPKEIRKINVNSASASELAAHPYIDWNLANSLVKLREQNGNYTKVEDIKRSALVNNELYQKLKNYLKVE